MLKFGSSVTHSGVELSVIDTVSQRCHHTSCLGRTYRIPETRWRYVRLPKEKTRGAEAVRRVLGILHHRGFHPVTSFPMVNANV